MRRITNPDRAYASIDLASIPKSTIVIDAWRVLRKQAEAGRGPNYVGLGLGDDNQRLSGALAGMWTPPLEPGLENALSDALEGQVLFLAEGLIVPLHELEPVLGHEGEHFLGVGRAEI